MPDLLTAKCLWPRISCRGLRNESVTRDVLGSPLARDSHRGADAAVPATLATGAVADDAPDAALELRVAVADSGRYHLDDVAHS